MGKKVRSKPKQVVQQEKSNEQSQQHVELINGKKKSIKKATSKQQKNSKKQADNEEISIEISKSDFDLTQKDVGKEDTKTTLEILSDLKNDLQILRSTLKKAEQQFQQHKKLCDTLQITIKSKRQSIQDIQKTIYTTEKDIIQKSIQTDKILFFNPFTFKDNDSFTKFYCNLKQIPEKINACGFISAQIQLKFTKLTSAEISYILRNIENQNKIQALKKHFEEFPYISSYQNNLNLLQSLFMEQLESSQQSQIEILKEIPYIFIRKCSFSKRLILSASNYLYKIIFNDPQQKIIKQVWKLCQQYFDSSAIDKVQVQQLISKGFINRQFVCLPQVRHQLRGFCFDKKIYINTYYIQQKQIQSDEIKTLYCVIVWIRELANLVFEQLFDKLQKRRVKITDSFLEHIQRKDFGVQIEKRLTKKEGFLDVRLDYLKIFQQQIPDFSNLALYQSDKAPQFIFQQYEKQNREKIRNISQKYMSSNINIQDQILEANDQINIQRKYHQIEDKSLMIEQQQVEEINVDK